MLKKEEKRTQGLAEGMIRGNKKKSRGVLTCRKSHRGAVEEGGKDQNGIFSRARKEEAERSFVVVALNREKTKKR